MAKKEGNGISTIPFAMSPPGFEPIILPHALTFSSYLYSTSPVGDNRFCNNYDLIILLYISAGKVPEILIMIILLYFDEFIYLLLGALEIFLFQIRLDISSLIYRYLL